MKEHTFSNNVVIDDTAVIEDGVIIGENTVIEAYCHLSSGCIIGSNCKIHRNVFVDTNVTIGNCVKIQNNNSIYQGVTLNDGVFVGTNVSFTNDKYPRAINADGTLKTSKDWVQEDTVVDYGAAIGSGATILCGLSIGKEAMVAAGAVVVRSVPDKALVCGNPAQIIKETTL